MEACEGPCFFFDEALDLLATRPLAATEFDPREHEWYRMAIDKQEQVMTDFYVFFTTGEVGISFARRLARGGGVVGADLALADLFDLFLTSGVFRKYAEAYLRPEQLDEVDVSSYLTNP